MSILQTILRMLFISEDDFSADGSEGFGTKVEESTFSSLLSTPERERERKKPPVSPNHGESS